jgi:sentrin-specific protease 1
MGGVDFRKRILSVLRTTKKEKKKRKKESNSDLPSKPSPLHEAKEEEEEERRRVRLRRQQEQQEQQPSHFVQYASPKTLQPVVLPRLKSSSFKEEEEEEEEKNEYVQKPVLSESQLRNIYSSNENKNGDNFAGGHLREEDALNDILTTPIVGRKVFVAEEEKKRRRALSDKSKASRYYGSSGKYSSYSSREEEEEFRFRSNEENSFDTFARAAKASRAAYATSSSPGFGKPALTFDREERLFEKQISISSRHTPLDLVKQSSATREELREIERRRRIEKEEGNRGGVIDLTGEAGDAEEEEEEEVPAEVIDLTSDNPPSSSHRNENIAATHFTPAAPDFGDLRRTKSATPKMGVGASSGRSSGGIKDEINKAHSADVGLKRFSRRKKHIDLIGRTARELVESAPEGEQLSQYKAQVAKFASEAYENDDDEKNEKNENETQRNLVEELYEKDDTGKTMVTTPKTTTTVTKMGGTHTKFNISPLSPTELKLEASARAAKRATTTFAAAAAEEEKDPLRVQLEALRLEQKKKEELRVKATEDRVKAEEEAAKEAIVEKQKAKEVDVFDQLPTPEEDERIDNAYDSGELVNHACARLPGQGVMPLKGKDIHTLAPVTWLNDECVNFTLGILGRRERERCGPKGHPRCHFFNTFFLNKLFQDDGEYDYNKVRRWSTEKKLGYLPIKCEKVIVPVHQGVHWVLAVVDLKRKVVSHYDSLLGKDREVVRNLIKWVIDEAKNKLNENWDISEWREEYPSEIPRQMNGSDCGMFMLNYARNIASFTDKDLRNSAFTFHQRDMVNLRRRLVLEILKIGLEMPADD